MVCFCFLVDQKRKVRRSKPVAGSCSRCGHGAAVADMTTATSHKQLMVAVGVPLNNSVNPEPSVHPRKPRRSGSQRSPIPEKATKLFLNNTGQ
nr:hypothetical protein F511_07170 [Ipomoea trifida]